MIIWQRWGIAQLLIIGLSIGTGFLLQLLILNNVAESGPQNGVFVGIGFIIGGVYTWLFNTYLLHNKLDRPRPLYTYVPLEQPYTNELGHTVSHRPVPIVNQETGHQVIQLPVSSFFFIPLKYWVYIMPAIGLTIVVITSTQLILS